MAVTFFEGFDSLTSVSSSVLLARGIFTDGGGENYALITPGRGGLGKAIHLSANATTVYGIYDVNTSEGAYGVGFQGQNEFTDTPHIFHMTDTDNIVANLKPTSLNTVLLTYNPAGSGNDISVSINVPNLITNYNYYEVRWTATVFEVQINNTVVYTKVQTGQPAFKRVKSMGTSNTRANYFDDIYAADDAVFRGDSYMRPLTNDATSTNTGTVVGAANAHTALTSFDGDTSYVDYTADGQKTLLTLSDISTNPSTIHAVCVARQARKSDTDTITESLLLSTASENVVGGGFTGLGLSHAGRRVVVVTDPHDSSAWTKAKVNAMEAGVKRGA